MYYNQNQNTMYYKSYIYLLLLTLAVAQKASEGTQGFYISPLGLSRARETHDALEKIAHNVTIARTTYKHSDIDYVIQNATITLSFMDARQVVHILSDNDVQVSGGRIEVYYQFNWSKVDAGKSTKGWATGFVMTDSVNYTKMLVINKDGYLQWSLTSGKEAFTQLTIFDRMRIKRMQPFNETDISALEDMLDRAITGIVPGTIEHQILQKLNTLLPPVLNATLNAHILGNEINYEFEHAVKGKLAMTIVHHLYDFSITKEEGYKVIFLSEIKDWPEPVCDGVNVPSKHLEWDMYGGTQNIQLNCLYQEVVEYMQKKGWLDTKLDTTWDSNAFQFYAGDLFQLINNLYLSASPRQLVSGECKASANGLVIKHTRDMRNNVLTLQVLYSCTAQTRDLNARYVDILNFNSEVKFYIAPRADKIHLDFSIVDAEIVSMEFKPVGSFYVQNLDLAYFKANQVLHKLRGTKVFGTGFPSLPRELPGSEVRDNMTIFFDISHRKSGLHIEDL